MEEIVPIFTFNILGMSFDITVSLVIQWVIMLSVLLLGILYKNNVRRIPGKIQAAVELVITKMGSFVEETMGEGKKAFVPYILALAVFILLLNLTGMFGIKPPTSEISVTLGLALTTFIVIQGYTIKKNGIKGYFAGFARPMALILPINIVERIMLPISLCLRLFGNVFAATMIIEMIYDALGKISFFATLVVPIPFHFYFDLFDGTIQAVIFIMLTMINIKITAEH